MNDELERRIEIATALVALVMAARSLVAELRRGRRLHTGHAALRLAAAVVGAVIAVRAVEEEIEEGS
ncbi:MAG: hypothetical protein ACJ74O_09785 [Frankiaceae bacterium]